MLPVIVDETPIDVERALQEARKQYQEAKK